MCMCVCVYLGTALTIWSAFPWFTYMDLPSKSFLPAMLNAILNYVLCCPVLFESLNTTPGSDLHSCFYFVVKLRAGWNLGFLACTKFWNFLRTGNFGGKKKILLETPVQGVSETKYVPQNARCSWLKLTRFTSMSVSCCPGWQGLWFQCSIAMLHCRPQGFRTPLSQLLPRAAWLCLVRTFPTSSSPDIKGTILIKLCGEIVAIERRTPSALTHGCNPA